ncbi:Transporter substrate-binding domain-containing protein [Rubrivivax sp. A210]|uniref:transporter substrate-binding domain-containing protein n=1 Tax=Rubrivivax sp. A210 TaxID=2772301 RepID=UPI0019188026|nr:transporter substrate-binding domain-containing protein [Rubrivivax sp. A210]CAD5367141.1 Transporter substrate-binding domain-containing protein [Rubrivivax sp. A210]
MASTFYRLLALLAAAGAALASAPALAQSGASYRDPQAPPPPPRVAEPAAMMRPAPALDTLATIRQRGVLRVGLVQVAPMAMMDRQQRYVGYSVDLAHRLADDLGVKLEFVEAWWANVIDELLTGRSDVIITGLWINVPRALVVNFSQPTATEGIYLIGSRASAAKRRTLQAFDQPGVTIAVSSDEVQQRVARACFPRAKVVPAEDDPLLVVSEGRADAAVVATLSAEAVVASAPRRWFLPSSQPLARTSAAMAVRKGDADFLAFLNTWLDIQRDQGWLDDRQRHWATSTEGFR